MRATLIGRFLLLAIVWLAVLLPLWYWAAKWFAAPPIWLAGTVIEHMCALLDVAALAELIASGGAKRLNGGKLH